MISLEEITKNASLVNEFLSQKGLGAIRGGDAPPNRRSAVFQLL